MDFSMSYQVLARKYRPSTLSTVVGHATVVQALSNALNQRRLHHAYLFTGTRGVGKTSLARILATALNCDEGVSSTPCGICTQCMAMKQGSQIDYLEFDAASHRGVDEMSNILGGAIYKPSQARFKVLMIDEVHMLTQHAFNAMLKILEEPPAHVKFILATTDPQKIPATIVSRCLQFHLRNLPQSLIAQHLGNVLIQENILQQEALSQEQSGLMLVAKHAQGSMRDALSILDQLLALGQGQLNTELLNELFGQQQGASLEVLQALAEQNLAKALHAAQNVPSTAVLEQLIEDIHTLSMAKHLDNYLDNHPYQEAYLNLLPYFDVAQLQMMYDVLLKGKSHLSIVDQPDMLLDMLLVRLCYFTMLHPTQVRTAAITTTSTIKTKVNTTAQTQINSIKPTLAQQTVAIEPIEVTKDKKDNATPFVNSINNTNNQITEHQSFTNQVTNTATFKPEATANQIIHSINEAQAISGDFALLTDDQQDAIFYDFMTYRKPKFIAPKHTVTPTQANWFEAIYICSVPEAQGGGDLVGVTLEFAKQTEFVAWQNDKNCVQVRAKFMLNGFRSVFKRYEQALQLAYGNPNLTAQVLEGEAKQSPAQVKQKQIHQEEESLQKQMLATPFIVSALNDSQNSVSIVDGSLKKHR